MDSKLIINIIADDLTGAADTGIQFAKNGLYSVLFPLGLQVANIHKSEVIALNTATRDIQPESAYDEVRNAVQFLMRKRHPMFIYKKIDSTLRGNVGVEIEAVMDATDGMYAILAPAFPACGRTTEAGVHFVNSRPVAHTEVANDLVNPVNESHIPTLIRSQTGLEVGHIALAEVRHGSETLQKYILQHIEDGEKIIVFDAITDGDLGIVAEAGMSMSYPPLMVGSAGLADQISRLWPVSESRRIYRSSHTKMGNDGLIIIVSGSLSVVTAQQLDYIGKVGKAEIISIDVCDQIGNQGNNLECDSIIVSKIMSAAETNRVIGIRSVKVTQPEEMRDLPRLVVDWLGKLVSQVVRDYPGPVQGLIITGGDTALAVFRQLKITQMHLIDEILPGIPYGHTIGDGSAGLDIVTKAGSFGRTDALEKCIDFLIGVCR